MKASIQSIVDTDGVVGFFLPVRLAVFYAILMIIVIVVTVVVIAKNIIAICT